MNFVDRIILRKEVNLAMNWIKLHAPWLLGAILTVVQFELPSFNAYIAGHPHSTLTVLLSAVVAAYYANSPLAKK